MDDDGTVSPHISGPGGRKAILSLFYSKDEETWNASMNRNGVYPEEVVSRSYRRTLLTLGAKRPDQGSFRRVTLSVDRFSPTKRPI